MHEPEREKQIAQLVALALEVRADERAALVHREARGDHDLTRDVLGRITEQEILACGEAETSADLPPREGDSHSAPTTGVERSPTSDGFDRHSVPRLDKIGDYTIRRVIASGGMGTVYLAQQESPRRPVAVKVMKQGVASRSALRRFEYESQILARLRHPNIAQVYGAGRHDDGEGGVPYFAMEYIPNAHSLTEHAERKSLSTRERLLLFCKVCDAVAHGHQKGIIHRDLKPSNILVDSSGEPKIIDFGVARATDSDMAVTTLQTDVGQLIGTLQYMSPEQCEADPHDLDIRSDVYALGVLLFELLCGELPYKLTSMPVYEAARLVREQSPAKPSTLDRTLRGDIETIVLKAMEKDRERRYQSALALQADINRYLRGDPIAARPPSMLYQLRLFARRRKGVFISIVLIASLLVLATTVSMWFGVQAHLARTQAESDRVDAENGRERESDLRGIAEQKEREAKDALADAEASREQAEQEAIRADAVAGFLEQMILAANPRAGGKPQTTVREILDEASKELDTSLADYPAVRLKLHRLMGSAYFNLGMISDAQSHLTKAVTLAQSRGEDDNVEYADLLVDLAYAIAGTSGGVVTSPRETRYAHLRRAYEIRKRDLGPQHSATLAVLADLIGSRPRTDDSVLLDELTIELLRGYFLKDMTDEQIIDRVNRVRSQITTRWQADDREGAIQYIYQIVAPLRFLPQTREYLARALLQSAGYVWMYGDPICGEALAHAALRIAIDIGGPNHMDVAIIHNGFGQFVIEETGDYKSGIEHFEEAYRVIKQNHGVNSLHRAAITINLARSYAHEGRLEEANDLYVEALSAVKSRHVDNLPAAAGILIKLADLAVKMEDISASLDWIEQGITSIQDVPELTNEYFNLLIRKSNALHTLERYEEMRPTALACATLAESRWGESHDNTITANLTYIDSLLHTEDLATATPLLKDAISLLIRRETELGRTFESQREKLLDYLDRAGMKAEADELR